MCCLYMAIRFVVIEYQEYILAPACLIIEVSLDTGYGQQGNSSLRVPVSILLIAPYISLGILLLYMALSTGSELNDN